MARGKRERGRNREDSAARAEVDLWPWSLPHPLQRSIDRNGGDRYPQQTVRGRPPPAAATGPGQHRTDSKPQPRPVRHPARRREHQVGELGASGEAAQAAQQPSVDRVAVPTQPCATAPTKPYRSDHSRRLTRPGTPTPSHADTLVPQTLLPNAECVDIAAFPLLPRGRLPSPELKKAQVQTADQTGEGLVDRLRQAEVASGLQGDQAVQEALSRRSLRRRPSPPAWCTSPAPRACTRAAWAPSLPAETPALPAPPARPRCGCPCPGGYGHRRARRRSDHRPPPPGPRGRRTDPLSHQRIGRR